MIRQDIRNLSIIAHVDHGKTTLVDGLLRQSGLFGEHEKLTERVMDSNDLEKERGITIMAKNTSIMYQNAKLNIVDTPGHADFGGEVERILGSVDGSILLVDASEGPLPQTRFVLQKALQKGHKVILCINKVDRPEVQGEGVRRINEVVDETFDLFVELGGTEEQCEFPIIYACAREGWCTANLDEVPKLISGEKQGNLKDLFDCIMETFSGPDVDMDGPFKMQLSNLLWSDYVGQLSVGRVMSGSVKTKGTVYRIGYNEAKQEKIIKQFTVTKLFAFQGLRQVEVEELKAGEIGIVAGCDEVFIGDTFTGGPDIEPFPRLVVDAPTLKMCFSITTSPFSGRDGEAIQSRKLRERLERETRSNVALSFEESQSSDIFYLRGRGELQFGILIETMRREGLEFMVGRPIVLMKTDENGQKLEPIERATLDLPEDHVGEVTELMQERKGILSKYENKTQGRVRLQFDIPSRGLIGLRSRFLTLTRGTGLISSEILHYEPFKGQMLARKNGTLIADRSGKCTDYALSSLEERGVLFIRPGAEVYEGMVIGECSRENDMNVNPVKPKKLTNIRTTASDGLIILAGIREMSLERCIEWIDDDEWIECTPKNIRIRKKELLQSKRTVIRGVKK